MPNAEAERGLHPARQRVERREARGEENAARPGSFRWESTAGSCCEVKRPSYEVVTGRRMWRKTQLGQGLHWEATPGGTAETWKRPACDVIANRRVLKLRPGYSKLCRRHGEKVRAHGALRPRHRGRSARRTPPPVSSGRSDQLQPPNRCPAGEGLITPTHWTRPRTKGLSLRPSARAACEGLNHFALAAFPRGRPCGTTRAEGLTPRFLGRETLEKPDNGFIIADRSWGCPGFRGLAAQSVRSSSV